METKTFIVDIKNSSVIWTGRKVLGEHTGTIDIISGEFVFNQNAVVKGNVIFDINSIMVTDITDPTTNAKLVGHLLADDFFAAEKYPTAEFNIVGSEHEMNDVYIINGTLTIRETSHSIFFPATIFISDGILSVNGKAMIDRTNFGMKFGSGNFFSNLGDSMIDNDFTLEINLSATPIS